MLRFIIFRGGTFLSVYATCIVIAYTVGLSLCWAQGHANFSTFSQETIRMVGGAGQKDPVPQRDEYAGKSLDELMSLLKTIKGNFYEPGIRGFSGDIRLFEAISKYGHSAVERLVGCMDKMEPVVATIFWEKPLLLGMMCHIAVDYVAYYEPEPGEEWEGTVRSLYPSPDEMIAAQKAWQKLVEKKLYILNEPVK